MDKKTQKTQSDEEIIKLVIIAASVLAVVITVILIFFSREQPYSVLYLKSYSNYLENKSVSFVYGVESHESKKASYRLSILFNGKSLRNETFELDAGGKREQNIILDLPLDSPSFIYEVFPAKVELLLEVEKRNYTVHFWLSESER